MCDLITCAPFTGVQLKIAFGYARFLLLVVVSNLADSSRFCPKIINILLIFDYSVSDKPILSTMPLMF